MSKNGKNARESVNIQYRCPRTGKIKKSLALKRKTGYEVVAEGGGRVIIPFRDAIIQRIIPAHISKVKP